jgi:hypothetical protein
VISDFSKDYYHLIYKINKLFIIIIIIQNHNSFIESFLINYNIYQELPGTIVF